MSYGVLCHCGNLPNDTPMNKFSNENSEIRQIDRQIDAHTYNVHLVLRF